MVMVINGATVHDRLVLALARAVDHPGLAHKLSLAHRFRSEVVNLNRSERALVLAALERGSLEAPGPPRRALRTPRLASGCAPLADAGPPAPCATGAVPGSRWAYWGRTSDPPLVENYCVHTRPAVSGNEPENDRLGHSCTARCSSSRYPRATRATCPCRQRCQGTDRCVQPRGRGTESPDMPGCLDAMMIRSYARDG